MKKILPFDKIHLQKNKKSSWLKFIITFLIVLGYLLFMIYQHGIEEGILATILTWSVFVMCTPIAGAGFIIDIPLLILFNLKIIYSEIIVWSIAIGLNIYTSLVHPDMYSATHLLTIFKKILHNPFPFWGIILISALGTFLSAHFGDELIHKVKLRKTGLFQKHAYNYRYIGMIIVFVITFVLYLYLTKELGIKI